MVSRMRKCHFSSPTHTNKPQTLHRQTDDRYDNFFFIPTVYPEPRENDFHEQDSEDKLFCYERPQPINKLAVEPKCCIVLTLLPVWFFTIASLLLLHFQRKETSSTVTSPGNVPTNTDRNNLYKCLSVWQRCEIHCEVVAKETAACFKLAI